MWLKTMTCAAFGATLPVSSARNLDYTKALNAFQKGSYDRLCWDDFRFLSILQGTETTVKGLQEAQVEASDALEMGKLKAWQSELLKEQMQQKIHVLNMFLCFLNMPAPKKVPVQGRTISRKTAFWKTWLRWRGPP